MDKISRLFFNQVQVLQKQLEHLLDKEPLQKTEIPSERPAFVAMTDLGHLDLIRMGLPNDLTLRVKALFAKLAPYFDSGLLFTQMDSQWKAVAGFDQGDHFPLKGVEIEIPFRFPDMSLVEVRRVNSPEIFSQLMDLQVLRSERGQALIFKPHPDYIFMVTSTLGDPWLKPHIERIQKEVLLLLGDY
ncbi:MAG: hypothetical protein ACAH59_06515 [Pseudobdellovibrionaceae bacterium]